jgi:dipeptidyl aminopeptidase/acylaminoacyl peptidase
MLMRIKAAVVALTLALAGNAAARPFTIDDALAIREVSDARISPDGKWIAYVETRNDLEADEQKSRIFVVSRDGAETRAMTGETYSASDPRWTPDGKYLSFIAARDDLDESAAAQVYTLNLKGGEAEAYTDVPQGVEGHEWSPDGKRLLLLIRDESEIDKRLRLAREQGESAKAAPFVIDRRQFKEDGVGYLDRTRAHLYIQEERLGEAKQITFGDYEDAAPQWRPDGAEIVFVSNRTKEPDSNDNTDLFVVSASPKANDPKPRRLTTNEGADAAPSWSVDGKRIAYVSSDNPKLFWYATNHLAVIDEAGGEPLLVTKKLDRNIGGPRFTAAGEAVIATMETEGEQRVVEISLATGEARPLISGSDTVYEFDLHASGALAAPLSRPDLPAEIFFLEKGTLTQATRVNEEALKDVRFARQQRVSFKSADGTTVQGFVYAPASGRKRTPAILNIHGGPTSQYDGVFDAEAQLYAANGFAVIQPNPRGSTGFGEAFAGALFADWGGVDFADVMAAVDDAIARGIADPKRLAVGGWSYGGILTNHVITKTDRFKAAISGASEVVYIGNYGHDIYQKEWEWELGLPWENREAWEKLTPFYDIAKVKTPTLVIGGKEDWNVPILNSEQLYQALKRLGVPTELVVYPDEDHSIDRPSFVRDRYERYLAWYRKYLR